MYLVLDLETTTKESFKRTANPFDKDNKIIVLASKRMGDAKVQTTYSPDGVKDSLPALEGIDLIVGQNIKFDLLYLWDEPQLQKWLKEGGKIWDTMVAEYLLTAQQSTYASLDKLAMKYGGSVKDDLIKLMWSVGLDTTEIDPYVLLPYAEQDILNTELVYLSQLEIARKEGMAPLIEGYMDHLLALVEMEYNGLYVDLDKLLLLKGTLETELSELSAALQDMTKQMFGPYDEVYDPQKNLHTMAVLFNTPVKFIRTAPLLDETGTPKVFGPKAQKAGQVIMRKEEIIANIQGFGLPPKDSTDIHILEALKKKYAKNDKLVLFIDTLLLYREKKKYLTTYIYGNTGSKETGLLPLIQNGGLIHHTLGCTKTRTGRLNGSNPNAQNIPKDLETLFSSRFGENGRIGSFDFSQLEVCVQAYLAQSENMIRDIKDGVDFHAKRLSYAEGLTYAEVDEKLKTDNSGIWAEKRRAAKTVSFQKAYGAGPEKIAKETNLSVETVERIFAEEDREYPEVKLFNKDVEASAKRSRIPTTSPLELREKETNTYIRRPGVYQGVGYYQSITSKKYHFLENGTTSAKLRAMGNDPYLYFSPTELANYPVQGTAADIVALSVGKVFRYILTHNLRRHLKMVNEVHDSLVLDIHKRLDSAELYYIANLLDDVDGTFKQYLGIGFNVPIKTELQIGPTWSKINE